MSRNIKTILIIWYLKCKQSYYLKIHAKFGHGIVNFCNSTDMQVDYLVVLVQSVNFTHINACSFNRETTDRISTENTDLLWLCLGGKDLWQHVFFGKLI